ncbi:alpha/beta hydrolase [Pseudomonas sp. MPFS]|uniref:alpha/beta hydrolase n=1 Tax=Pseudomonas sp. MPFS TaxID=2795724 RepID=UPI001F147718|nr:alpha/beta hydrolase [Pseudomonas sp. MPFS]UMZ12090.1 alpha/beta hydrolase [Pseudomonas sp. MPFS]
MSIPSISASPREVEQVNRANASGKQPVILVHGLWLLADSWKSWQEFFEARGFSTVAVDWPGDQRSYTEAHANPDTLAGLSVADIAEHVAAVIALLERKPVVIGHSLGGLLAQMIAGRGIAAATIAIDPAPCQGVLPVPLSTVKATLPVLANPLNHGRTVTLTFDQFRYGFANAVSESEARHLYETIHTPAPGRPLFQAATANLNPWSVAKADNLNPARGPLLVVVGEKDNIVPVTVASAAYKRQRRNGAAPTEFVVIPGAGHSLVVDGGWREVADAASVFLARQGIEA